MQIKTLELLIIQELHSLNGYNQAIHSAFSQVLRHFSEEEYLYGIEHETILNKIYINRFYKFHSTEALSQELHIDTKTLLIYRKSYLHLFARFYLGLSSSTQADLYLLYEKLKESTSKGAMPHEET